MSTAGYEMNPAAEMNPASAQVVIVDDSDDAALSLSMLFDLEGISTATASDAESALSLIERTQPALCLIDIGLPGISGAELAHRLRAMPSTRAITLIALTGREAGLDAQSRSQAEVFDQYWTKPFDPKRLISEVQAIIARASGR